MIIVVIILNSIFWFVMHGIPLIGVPDKENVESITLIYDDSKKEISNAESISLLITSASLCNYNIGKTDKGSPEITIIYHMKEGTDIELAANSDTMWWKGHPHRLKEKASFVNIIKGLYFQNADMQGS